MTGGLKLLAGHGRTISFIFERVRDEYGHRAGLLGSRSHSGLTTIHFIYSNYPVGIDTIIPQPP